MLDLTQPGGRIPDWLFAQLCDADTIKHAYNAAFEWYCLSRHFGVVLPVDQWRCTMLHALYCGYPAGLAATGKALGLEEDKQKLTAGKALIRYFCVPCKPTKSNGGRQRNLPHHDPAKWELFKTYNGQDVVAEMEIEHFLSAFPVPDDVQAQWVTDQRINARGVAVDTELVQGALELDAAAREGFTREAAQITGLDNPNSVSQVTGWLERETGQEVADLRKSTVSELLTQELDSENARRMLELRQMLGKTRSTRPWPWPPAMTAGCAVYSSSMAPTGQGGGRGASCSPKTCPGPTSTVTCCPWPGSWSRPAIPPPWGGCSVVCRTRSPS